MQILLFILVSGLLAFLWNRSARAARSRERAVEAERDAAKRRVDLTEARAVVAESKIEDLLKSKAHAEKQAEAFAAKSAAEITALHSDKSDLTGRLAAAKQRADQLEDTKRELFRLQGELLEARHAIGGLESEVSALRTKAAEQEVAEALDGSQRLLPEAKDLASSSTDLCLAARQALLPSSFLDVVAIHPVAEGMRSSLDAQLAIQGVGLATQVGSFALNNGAQVTKFSGMAKDAIQMSDKVSGALIPTLRDRVTGVIVENARVDKLAGAAGKLATATAAVVAVANMISAYDQVKRLKDVQGKLDVLVKARRWDQFSEIETVYWHAKEILAKPGFADGDRRELHRLCQTLRKLRISWRHELHHKLEQVNPERTSGWTFDWFGLAKDSRDKEHAATAHSALGVLDAELHLMEVSVALQSALSWASGTHEVFLTDTLPGESRAWEQTRDLFSEKLTHLKRYETSPADGAGHSVMQRWASMIGRAQASAETVQAISKSQVS